MMLSSAQYDYYHSPWYWPVLLFLLLVLVTSCLMIWKRQTLIRERGKSFFYGILAVNLVIVIGPVAMSYDRFSHTGKPRVIVHREFMDCWGNAGRVPWHHFTNISRERGGMYNTDIVLRFSLSSRYIKDFDWGDWVRSHGWVNCTISGLTDNPRRFGFTTNTDEIYQQVHSAWRSARWVWDRPTYDEMFKMELKPRD